MALVLNGISVSRGLAIGKAHRLQRTDLEVNEYIVPKPLLAEEITRFRVAVKKAKQQLKAIRGRIPARTPTDITEFIDTHLLMLEDAALVDAPIVIIGEKGCNAEWALKIQSETLVTVFDEMNDPYLRTRKDDVNHVVERILCNLMAGQEDAGAERRRYQVKGRVVIAEEVPPAELLLLAHQGMAALVTRYGGANSHTAILARSLGIPAVAGVAHVLKYVHHNELVVLDGAQGFIMLLAPEVALQYFREQQRKDKKRQAELKKICELPAVSCDGQRVQLLANVEIPEDIPLIRNVAAAGIGLYRTEMLFLNRQQPPDEEEQFTAYGEIVSAMAGAPVTIRTLDLGADQAACEGLCGVQRAGLVAANPAMGLRAIRCSLQEPTVFGRQIRAILRASALGPVKMMVPMVSSLQELAQVLRLVAEEKKTLRRRRQAFDDQIPLGVMIEIPAAALIALTFARRVDFLSIGTNDLIQYTLAVDRLDEQVNYLYDPLHPAILKLIQNTLAAGRKAGVPVAMCGEMAGDIRYTRLLLGMGLREFSMYPATLLEVKQVVKDTDIPLLEKTVRKILQAETREQIMTLVEELNAAVCTG